MRLPANLGSRAGAVTPRVRLPIHRLGTRAACRLGEEEGFTIIEAIVAALVLTIGLLTVYLMLAVAVHSSADVRQREEGVSLARQVTEDARSIPYAQLANSTIVTMLQAYPGLANQGSGSTWQIKRGGYWYTVTASLTNLNDPKDTSGGTDVKQFTVNVNWSTYQANSHTYTESAIMSRAGQDPGLQASSLLLASPPWGSAGVSGTQSAPVVTSTGITSLQFTVIAPSGTQAIVWTLNGNKQTSWNGSAPSSGTTWTSSSWPLSGVSDGTYTVAAAAEDSNGVDGPAVTMTVRLIRNVPSAPSVTGYGFNAGLQVGGSPANAAEVQWSTNPELNVVGYRVYYNNSSGGQTLICSTSTSTSYPATCPSNSNAWCSTLTSCVDLSPPPTSSSFRTYTVKALYFDANNTLSEGNATNVTLASGTPTAPSTPVSLTVQTQLDGTAILTWPVSAGGSSVNFYRVYRDGTNYTSRYDVVAASNCTATCTYHDYNRAEGHSYVVTAVGGTALGSDMDESAPTSVVTG